MILDTRTGKWSNTAPIPTPRYGHSCLLTEIDDLAGVMVTGILFNVINIVSKFYYEIVKTMKNEPSMFVWVIH